MVSDSWSFVLWRFVYKRRDLPSGLGLGVSKEPEGIGLLCAVSLSSVPSGVSLYLKIFSGFFWVPSGANVTGAGATSVYTLCLVTVFDVVLMACGWNRRGFDGELGRLLSGYCSILANLGFLFGVDGGDVSEIVLERGVDRSNGRGFGEQILIIRSKCRYCRLYQKVYCSKETLPRKITRVRRE